MITKQSVKDCVDLLQAEFKNSIFSSRYSIKTSVHRNWQSKDKATTSRTIECYARGQDGEESAALNALTDSIKQKMNADKKKYSFIEEFTILTQLQEGDKLPAFKNLTDLYKQTSTEIKHQKGEVILIDVWSTLCEACYYPMQLNQEMLSKNSVKWGDKVRIIGVSVDDKREDIIKIVEEKKWNKIIHLKLNGWDEDHPIIKDFSIERIPFVALVDTEGNLNYTGHSSSINLEERISSLLEKKLTDKKTFASASASDLSNKQYYKAKLLIDSKLSEFQGDASFDFSFEFSKTKLIKSDSQLKTYNKPSYSSRYDKIQEKGYLEFIAKLIQFLGKDFPLKKEQEIFTYPKFYLNSDLKSLKKIFEDNSLKTVETQHLVSLKLKYENGKFTQSRKDKLVQHKKISQTLEFTTEKLDAISQKVKDFAQNRYESESYADYLLSLLDSGISGQEERTEAKSENHEQEYKKFKEAFKSKAIENIESTLNLNYNPQLKLKVERHRVFDYQGNMIRKYYDKPSISYTVRKDDEQAMQVLLNKVFEQVPEANFKVVPQILDIVKVEVGTSCDICSAELRLPQYYNYFQKQHLCLPCGDKRDTNIKTIKQFNVSDNLIFINSPNPPEFELYKLGKNTKPSEEEEIEFSFEYWCDGCRGSDDSRYVCLNCSPGPILPEGFVDLCKSCFSKMTFEKNSELLEKVKSENHQIDHSLLMIRTPEGDYFDY